MNTNTLISRIDGKDPLQLLPEHMDAEFLAVIATKLSKWKRGELPDPAERVELEEFSQRWGTMVLPSCHPALGAAMYEGQNCILTVLVVMGELDYMVQQEIVSRELQYRSYGSRDLFDKERLKLSVPQFVSRFFKYNGMEPFANENVQNAMSASISRFLEERLAEPISKVTAANA